MHKNVMCVSIQYVCGCLHLCQVCLHICQQRHGEKVERREGRRETVCELLFVFKAPVLPLSLKGNILKKSTKNIGRREDVITVHVIFCDKYVPLGDSLNNSTHVLFSPYSLQNVAGN